MLGRQKQVYPVIELSTGFGVRHSKNQIVSDMIVIRV